MLPHHDTSGLDGKSSGTDDTETNSQGPQKVQREIITQFSQSPSASKPASPSVKLPVTKKRLSALDITTLCRQLMLRHNTYFTRQPLRKSSNVNKKREEEAQPFWAKLEEQLEIFILSEDQKVFDPQKGYLTIYLENMKEIVPILIPQEDRQIFEEWFDIPLLLQQLSHRAANLDKLWNTLAVMLQRHCAPARDEWIDKVCKTLEVSAGSALNTGLFIEGLKELLMILEYMKLDLANHQIEKLRPRLIEETVDFEVGYFKMKIDSGQIRISDAKDWYKTVQQNSSNQPSALRQELGDIGVFFEALVQLILPSTTAFPETFQLDHFRLLNIRSEITDAIHIEICMSIYEDFSTPNPKTRQQVLNKLLALLHSENDDINQEAERRNLSPQMPIQNWRKAKWCKLSPQMAVQICRAQRVPLFRLKEVEKALTSTIGIFGSAKYRDAEGAVLSRLTGELSNIVSRFLDLSAVSIDKIATAPQASSLNDRDSMKDIAIRIAHLGVLHWQVWCRLAYLEPIATMENT